MAEWWMDDTEIAISYRLAKNQVYQIQVLAELNLATIREVAYRLVSLGELSEEDAEVAVRFLSERHSAIYGDLEDKCLNLYKSGYSDRAIGKFLDLSKGQVQYWRHKKGYPPNVPAKGFDGKWR